MVNLIKGITKRARLWVQVIFTALTNGYAAGFLNGKIYTGQAKVLCVPGLNCYSCPGALGSCPIGSLQAVLGSRNYKFSFYIIGFMMLAGSLAGRLICGWLCPFGLIQDALHKIPLTKKCTKIPGHKFFVRLKYIILIIFVILLPLLALDIVGQGQPWFCKYICPSGTLMAGIPLVLTNELLREAVGLLYYWKMGILILLILASIKIYRPFCKYLCPLGAVYSFFNPIALYKYSIDNEKCTGCGECARVCKMNVNVRKNPNSGECIRCGDCIAQCPENAIKSIKTASGIVKDSEVQDNI